MPRQAVPQKLLRWYDRHARVLPWRARRGEVADPYRVWLSEIMLQQTTVRAVAEYFSTFLIRWPRVEDLAAAPLDEVLAAWAGLGYYARARNLHKAARTIVEEWGGKLPASHEDLRTLPGVGDYTASAIAAIAFDLPHAAMDANAERVVARLFAVREVLPKAKPALRKLGQSLVPAKRAGDFAQAMMDLGATLCTPKRPACPACPLNGNCEARRLGLQDVLPMKGRKAPRPLKRGAAFVARDAEGAVLLVRRASTGLLAGMDQPPLGAWSDRFPSREQALSEAPFKAPWRKRAGLVRHGFTHFELEIEVYETVVARRPKCEGRWVADLDKAALPTVMRKIIGAGPRRR
ncbi:MAG: A/G-specific adenine glycosylase [Alphaproteobacteria bacterium]|nr:A/G-specific adenine glycosylase [Alphaproteobacteria bacterium]MBV9692348.1 A/G-specific adenine glycosylase [Alphaproteobacteria bacterium]